MTSQEAIEKIKYRINTAKSIVGNGECKYEPYKSKRKGGVEDAE
jgi:hypothetical protein